MLLSLIEQPAHDREVILDAVFAKSRDELVAAARSSTPAGRDLAERALAAHDYVFDVFST